MTEGASQRQRRRRHGAPRYQGQRLSITLVWLIPKRPATLR